MRAVIGCCVLVVQLGGCGARTSVWDSELDLTWLDDPENLVVELSSNGGFWHSWYHFRNSFYGAQYVRLTGDGRLFAGTPKAARFRQLTEQQMQKLLGELRPRRLARHTDDYSLSEYTEGMTTRLSIRTEPLGEISIRVYQYDAEDERLPRDLVNAVSRIEHEGKLGEPYQPTALFIGVAMIDVEAHELGPSETAVVPPWPVPSIDLSQVTRDEGPVAIPMLIPSTYLRIDDAEAVKLLLPLLALDPQEIPFEPNMLFEQAGQYYFVVAAIALP